MRFQRAYVSAARECPLDGQGRVVIPPVLRQYAGLKREAILTGETHKFSIWDREQWQALAADDLTIFDDPARMKALDL
jgi:MraZ protein